MKLYCLFLIYLTNWTKSLPFASKTFSVFLNFVDYKKPLSPESFYLLNELTLFNFEYPVDPNPKNMTIYKNMRLNVIYHHLTIEQVSPLIFIYIKFFHDRHNISMKKMNWNKRDIDEFLFTHFYSILYFHYTSIGYKELLAIYNYALYTKNENKELLLSLILSHPIHAEAAYSILSEIIYA